MSFFNKLWKNLRDHKTSQPARESREDDQSFHHHHHHHHHRHHHHASSRTSSQEDDQSTESTKYCMINSRNSKEWNLRKTRGLENVAPNDELPSDSMIDDFQFTPEELDFLPPGIVTEIARHPTVSRHLSVSRSGRYKHRFKKRSNLFDVVSSEEDGRLTKDAEEDLPNVDCQDALHIPLSSEDAKKNSSCIVVDTQTQGDRVKKCSTRIASCENQDYRSTIESSTIDKHSNFSKDLVSRPSEPQMFAGIRARGSSRDHVTIGSFVPPPTIPSIPPHHHSFGNRHLLDSKSSLGSRGVKA